MLGVGHAPSFWTLSWAKRGKPGLTSAHLGPRSSPSEASLAWRHPSTRTIGAIFCHPLSKLPMLQEFEPPFYVLPSKARNMRVAIKLSRRKRRRTRAVERSTLFGVHCPPRSRTCYLPTDEERAWLRSPPSGVRSGGSDTLRDHLNKPGLTAAQLRDLVPHYLQSVGARKWSRLPSDRQLLSKTVLEILRKNPDVQIIKLQELIRGKVTCPHPERIGPCCEWVLDKLASEGYVTRDLLSVQYRDLGKEIREIRAAIKKRQKELEASLARLRSCSEQQWQAVRATASRAREEARQQSSEHGMDQVAFARVQNLDQQLREVIANLEARLNSSRAQLQTLETEVVAWLTERRARIDQIHADWRELLGLTTALGQLELAASAVSRLAHLADSEPDQDRVGAAELEYQRAAVRKDQIDVS